MIEFSHWSTQVLHRGSVWYVSHRWAHEFCYYVSAWDVTQRFSVSVELVWNCQISNGTNINIHMISREALRSFQTLCCVSSQNETITSISCRYQRCLPLKLWHQRYYECENPQYVIFAAAGTLRSFKLCNCKEPCEWIIRNYFIAVLSLLAINSSEIVTWRILQMWKSTVWEIHMRWERSGVSNSSCASKSRDKILRNSVVSVWAFSSSEIVKHKIAHLSTHDTSVLIAGWVGGRKRLVISFVFHQICP